jgi:Do/DeqQ family serine protease
MLKTVLVVICLGLLVGAGLLLWRSEGPLPFARGPWEALDASLESEPVARDAHFAISFAPIVEQSAPSVVNVYTTRTVGGRIARTNPLVDDPLFRHFFRDRLRSSGARQERSLGSGVVIGSNGYIITSHHVIEDADQIHVSLENGPGLFSASVVGVDPPTDIALLKVDSKALPAIRVADSDLLAVGDLVLAIGNPFGLGQTVTRGIVSGTERGGFGVLEYEDFIQTDASINPGNSGGALVDVEGRLVGINTALLSQNGSSQGVGFAVPINLALSVAQRLIQEGRVVRAYLGASVQTVSQEVAGALGMPERAGALVLEVVPGSPAEEAGLQEGDVITHFNEQPVRDGRRLRLLVSQAQPGETVPLTVRRSGTEEIVRAELRELRPKTAISKKSRDRGPRRIVPALDLRVSRETSGARRSTAGGASADTTAGFAGAGSAGLITPGEKERRGTL